MTRTFDETDLAAAEFAGRVRRNQQSFLAEELVGPERDRLFHLAAGASSPYDHYQQSAAARPIAVIAFHPIG
jgi:hypothetical protein